MSILWARLADLSVRAGRAPRIAGRLWVPQEAVKGAVRVNFVSRDRALCIVKQREGTLASASARSWSVKLSDLPMAPEQEAVVDTAAVNVTSRDLPFKIKSFRHGALASACARAGNIERSDSAVRS